MKNSKYKAMLLAVSLGFGISGSLAAAPSCAALEYWCNETDDFQTCRDYYRYCL